MAGWIIGLGIWFAISLIIALIIRVSLGKRDEAWECYSANLNDWSNPALPHGCLVLIGTIALLPGFLAVALWDWVLAYVPSNVARKIRHSREFKAALKRLLPFERECYNKIQELRGHRRELQNVLIDQENDGDPDTPTRETQRLVNERLKQLKQAENGLRERVSSLPMGDLQVHQRLAKAQEAIAQANQLVETANDPEIQMFRGGSSVSREELKQALVELNQQ